MQYISWITKAGQYQSEIIITLTSFFLYVKINYKRELIIKKISFNIIFLILFHFSVAGLFAQEDVQELRIGSSVEGYFENGEERWYSARSAQTSFLVIETTGGTDTYLEVYDARNNLLMENDDAGDGINARVDIYVTAGSVYNIKVRGYNDSISGQYHIQANYRSIPSAAELRFGTFHAGRLSAGEDYWFNIRTAGNGIITVETFGNTDTYLDIYSNSYVFLYCDDDSGDDKNSRIEFNASAGQSFFIRLRAFNRNASGSFRIQASFRDTYETAQVFDVTEPFIVPYIEDTYVPPAEPLPPDTHKNTNRSRAVFHDPDEEISVIMYGGLNEGRWYSFEAAEDDTDFIIYTRGNINSFLYLYDSHGEQISRDDNSGEGYNALISKTLDAGIYYIEVMEFFNRAGRCTLYIEKN